MFVISHIRPAVPTKSLFLIYIKVCIAEKMACPVLFEMRAQAEKRKWFILNTD
jgi:hypothetical protein